MIRLSFLFLLLCAGASLSAQHTRSVTYDTETIYLLGFNRYVKNNQVYSGHRQLKSEFSISVGGMDLYRRSRRNRTIGLAISLAGTAGTVYALASNRSQTSRTFFWVSLGTGLAAAPFNGRANSQLNQAVWLRNRDALLLFH